MILFTFVASNSSCIIAYHVRLQECHVTMPYHDPSNGLDKRNVQPTNGIV